VIHFSHAVRKVLSVLKDLGIVAGVGLAFYAAKIWFVTDPNSGSTIAVIVFGSIFVALLSVFVWFAWKAFMFLKLYFGNQKMAMEIERRELETRRDQN
jgi:hypothetical protein